MKPFTTLAVVILSLIALVQLIRVVLGWPVIVNGIGIPLWLSGVACVVAATCAVMVVREARR
jgi:hypothetical protein